MTGTVSAYFRRLILAFHLTIIIAPPAKRIGEAAAMYSALLCQLIKSIMKVASQI